MVVLNNSALAFVASLTSVLYSKTIKDETRRTDRETRPKIDRKQETTNMGPTRPHHTHRATTTNRLAGRREGDAEDKYPAQPVRAKTSQHPFHESRTENKAYLTRTRSRLAVLRISHQESSSLGLLVARAATLSPLLLPRGYEAGRCRRCTGRESKASRAGRVNGRVRRNRRWCTSHINL